LWFVTHCTLRRLPANSASSSRLTTGYQVFLARAVEAEVLGVRAKIACLEEVTRATLWAYGDPRRRLSKRKEGELDLIRLTEAYPALKPLYPAELREQLDRGWLLTERRSTFMNASKGNTRIRTCKADLRGLKLTVD
jgi:hypothetical protein